MKAVRFSQFGGPEVLEIVDLPDPHAGAGQVRIAVRAAGVNQSDWKKRKGLMDPDLPQNLGYEAAGRLPRTREGVSQRLRRRSAVRPVQRRGGPSRIGSALLLRTDPALA